MNDRRAAVKVTLLVAPLLLFIVVLHAWGDAMAGGLGRAVIHWQYPERLHSAFVIRVPRRTDADGFAARALEDFVQKAVKAHGATLGLKVPTQPVTVVLLDPTADPRRFGATTDDLGANQAVFDPSRRLILARMDRALLPALATALGQAAANLLLYDAGSARWSPWLTEGLLGQLEGTSPTEWRALTGELPGVADILKCTEADFNPHTRTAASKGARLLTAFLLDRPRDKFLAYYKDEQAGLRPSFADLIGDPDLVERDWKDWIQKLK